MGFPNFQNLIRANVGKPLADPARPPDFNFVDLFPRARSEVNAEMARGSISHGRCHVVALIADPDFCADSIAIALRARQVQYEPRVLCRRNVFQQFGPLAERRYHYIHAAVPVEIGEGATSVSARRQEIRTGALRDILKCAVAAI
jgi:hypothetical protein